MKRKSIPLFFIAFAISGCITVQKNSSVNSTLPFKIDIIKESREIVMTQTLPKEEQMLGYFKVLKITDNFWQMWYSSWDNKRKDDYSGYLEYAYSKDGLSWTKEIPGKQSNVLRGTGHPQKDGVVEQDIFIEPADILKYKMIYTAKDNADNDKEKTFIEESEDGINWVNRRVLWSQKHDSQFSVIQRDDLYYVYLRHWEIENNIRYRTIGLAVLNKQWNVIQAPKNIFKSDFKSKFPHLYNPGASKLNKNLDILFPTFFNEKTNEIKFGLAYVRNNIPVLTDIDLTTDFLDDTNSNWGIISPGLIPASAKNVYWLYYYATNMIHSDYDKAGRKFTYYRIKVKIISK